MNFNISNLASVVFSVQKNVEPQKPAPPPPTQKFSLEQKNAVKKAESYLSFSSFSREGLIDQLEFEGFTHDEAVYGASRNGY